MRPLSILSANAEQVETLLKNQESVEPGKDGTPLRSTATYVANTAPQPLPTSDEFTASSDRPSLDDLSGLDAFQNNGTNVQNSEGYVPWEMIGLGLEEPLPPQDVQDDLWVPMKLATSHDYFAGSG